MKITVTIPKVKFDAKAISRDAVNPLLNQEMQNTNNRISRAIESGQDPTGNAFPAYSKSYAEYKSRKLNSTVVNLTETGAFRRSMQVREAPDKNGYEIFFLGSHGSDGFSNSQLAEWLAGQGRDVAQYGQIDVTRIMAAVQKFFERAVGAIVKIEGTK